MISRRNGDSLTFDPRRLVPLLSLFIFLFLPLAPAQAHPESLSNLRLVLGAKELRATLTLPLRDLTGWFPPGRYHNYIADVVGELQKTGDSLLEVSWDDAAALTPLSVNVHPGNSGFIVADLRYPVPDKPETLIVRTAEIGNLPDAHQQVAWAEDERAGAANSRVIVEQVLTAQDDTLKVELPDPPTPNQSAAAAALATPIDSMPVRAAGITQGGRSSLASSRTVKRAAIVLLPVILFSAFLARIVVNKRRLLTAREASEASTWITSA